MFCFSANAVLSNGATVWPFEIVSLPPFAFEPVSSECCFASAAKLRPAVSCALRASAFAFVLTRMWRTSRLSGWLYCALFFV